MEARLEQLLETARFSKKNKNYNEAVKYYSLIATSDPMNWEAQFYVAIFEMYTKGVSGYGGRAIKDISKYATQISEAFTTAIHQIKNYGEAGQKREAVSEISADAVDCLKALFEKMASLAKEEWDKKGITEDFKKLYDGFARIGTYLDTNNFDCVSVIVDARKNAIATLEHLIFKDAEKKMELAVQTELAILKHEPTYEAKYTNELYEKCKKALFGAQSKEQYEKTLASLRELSEHNYLDTAEIVEKVEQALEKHPIIEKEVKFVNKMYPVVFFPDEMFFDKTNFSYNEIESVKIGKPLGIPRLEINIKYRSAWEATCKFVSADKEEEDKLKEMLDIILERIKEYVPEGVTEEKPNFFKVNKSAEEGEKKEGCYVATCVYGSYDCPQVWTLRRYRDNTLGSTWYGRAFIRIYYAISPALVRMFGKTKAFKAFWRKRLDKMISRLNSQGVENTPYKDKNWR